MQEYSDGLARMEVLDSGKPLVEAKVREARGGGEGPTPQCRSGWMSRQPMKTILKFSFRA